MTLEITPLQGRTHKVCGRCKINKPVSEYSLRKDSEEGLLKALEYLRGGASSTSSM